MVNIYDAAGEDGAFQYQTGSIGAGFLINTTGNTFRSLSNGSYAYARCSIQVFGGNHMIRIWPAGVRSVASVGMRVSCNSSSGDPLGLFIGLVDGAGVVRIALRNTLTTNGPGGPYNVYKIDALGTLTLLGTTSGGFSILPTSPDQFTMNYNYSTSGSLVMYVNGNQIFSFTGDVTTDGLTALGGSYHGSYLNGGAENCSYSEVVVVDTDARNVALVTSEGAGPGTLDQWTGAVTNVNEIQVNDTNFDTTAVSGSVQRYAMSAIGTGNFTIVGKVTSLRCTQGTGLLSHIAQAELINGTPVVGSAQAFPPAFQEVLFIEQVNPVTGVAFTQGDINGARESGYQATT